MMVDSARAKSALRRATTATTPATTTTTTATTNTTTTTFLRQCDDAQIYHDAATITRYYHYNYTGAYRAVMAVVKDVTRTTTTLPRSSLREFVASVVGLTSTTVANGVVLRIPVAVQQTVLSFLRGAVGGGVTASATTNGVVVVENVPLVKFAECVGVRYASGVNNVLTVATTIMKARRRGDVVHVGEQLMGVKVVATATEKHTTELFDLSVPATENFLVSNAVVHNCKHRNIVALYKTFSSPENLYYVIELCPNGELLDLIKKAGRFTHEAAAFYTAEITEAIEYLHSIGIIHRDLKPENVLLSADWHVKLTDFGTSKLLDDTDKANPTARVRTNSFVGTAEYIAPEMLSSHETCRASDLFALGSIVFQMLVGRPPFQAKTEYLTLEKVKAREFEYDDDANVPDSAKSLISALFELTPEERLGAGADGYAKLKAHDFFAGIDWANLATTKPPKASDAIDDDDAAGGGAGGAGGGGGGGAADGVVGGTDGGGDGDGDSSDDDNDDGGGDGGGGGGGGGYTTASTLDEEYAKHLFDGEKVIKAGTVLKYKGMSVKKRQLVLTDKPRLLYIDREKDRVMGEILWSPSIYAVAKNTSSFYINTPQRRYILSDKLTKDADGWVRAIDKVKMTMEQQAD